MKKVISVFLAVLMIISILPISVFAQEQKVQTTETEQEINYNASNALGEVVVNAMNESESEDEGGYGYFIQDVEINGFEAIITLSSPDESTVVVAIFDEESNIMVTSGNVDVDSTTESVTVELAECEMPDYFVVKAFLLNSENEPLCKSYESRHYTKAFEDFFEKTVFDFDEDKVINLDYGYETNFAVVSDDAKLIKQSEAENILITNDYENGIYVFENANKEILSLKQNEVLYFVYGEGADEYILTKIGTIENDNGTVTVTAAEEFEISDFFSYIKIDSTQLVNEKPQTFSLTRSFDDNSGNEDGFSDEFSISVLKEYESDDDIDVSFSGEFKAKFYLKFYYDFNFGEDYYEITQTSTLAFIGKTEIFVSAEKELEPLVLFHGGIPIYAGIEAEVTFALKLVFSAKLSASGSVEVNVVNGSRKISGRADENISKAPSIKLGFDISGTVAFDIMPSVSVGFKILKIVKVSVEINAGFQISGIIHFFDGSTDESLFAPDEKHACSKCIDGDIKLSVSGSIKVSFGLNEKKQKTVLNIDLFTSTIKLSDFYISIITENGLTKDISFGLGTCPNIQYKVTFSAIDEYNAPLEGVVITVGTNTFKTDNNGNVSAYFYNGTYSCKTEFAGYEINKDLIFFESINFSVYDGAKKVLIYMKESEKSDFSNVYNEYLTEILIPKYGIACNFEKTFAELGIKSEQEICNYIPVAAVGINSVYIDDINNDDVFEMIVVRTEMEEPPENQVSGPNCYWNIFVELYVIENNKVIYKNCIYESNKYDNADERIHIYTISYNDARYLCIADNYWYGASTGSIFGEYFQVFSIDSLNNIVKNYDIRYHYSHGNLTYFYNDEYYKVADDGVPNDFYDSTKILIQGVFDSIGLSEINIIGGKSWNVFPEYVSNQKIFCGGTNYLSEGGNSAFSKDYTSFSDEFKNVRKELERGVCGENLTWVLYNDDELVISGVGAMDDYLGSYFPWYSYRSSIKKVTIGNSITAIDDYAFSGCHSLESITVGENNQYYSSDEYGVLFNKEKTELIQYPIGNSRAEYSIPDSVTTIGDDAFWLCDSLESVTIGNSVTLIGDCAFHNCNKLKNITIPENVSSIGEGAFWFCDSLEKITVGENNQYYSSDEYGVLFNKEKTELIQYPIGNSRAEYSIPDSVTTIGDDAFWLCDSLESVTIGNSVTLIGDCAFHNCNKLKNITIPENVSSIGEGAFWFCDSLEKITVDEDNEFYSNDNCGVLFNKKQTEIIQYPAGNMNSTYEIPFNVTFIHDCAFMLCDNIQSFTVNKNNINYLADEYGVLFNSEMTELILYPIGNSRNEYVIPRSVEVIKHGAFRYSENISIITIPDSVTTIADFAFNDCNNLNTVYYTGTAAQWSNIDMWDYCNDGLLNANITYNYSFTEIASVMSISRMAPPMVIMENVNTEIVDSTVIGNDYIMLIVKDAYAEDLLASENLLYIDQKTAVSETLTFEFNLNDDISEYYTLFYNADLNFDNNVHEHTFGEWVVVKAPTATEEGIEECVCSVCGGKETRTIEKLNYIVGDVNGDGKITAADARIVLRISAKLDSMENYNLPLEAFDVTGDGKITAADARKVLRISAKLEK